MFKKEVKKQSVQQEQAFAPTVEYKVGDIVIYEGLQHRIVEVQGAVLHIKNQVIPFNSALVGKDEVQKGTE